jgi:outer membrane protein
MLAIAYAVSMKTMMLTAQAYSQPRNSLKRFVLGMFVVLTLFPMTTSAQDTIKPGETLDLAQCIAFALKMHPNVLGAAGSVMASQSKVSQARSNYFPQISWSATYDRTHPAGITSLPGGGGDSYYDEYKTQVSLSQTLYDFGKTSTQVKVQALGADSSQADLDTTTSQVIFGVKQAYYGVLQAKQSRTANVETVGQFEQHLTSAKKFFEVGIKPKFDVTKAEVDLSQAKLNLLKAENALTIAHITLNNAMGVPEAPVFDILDTTTLESYAVNLEEVLAKGYERRSDLQSTRAKREAAQRSIDLARKGYYPVLSGNAGYGGSGQDFPLEKEWSLGASTYQIDEARANLDIARANEELVKQTIRFEIEQAFSNLKEVRERITLADLTVKQAQENRELAQGRYAAGVGNAIEVTDALVTEINAKTAYITAIYDYRLAIASLEKAMGGRE